VAGTTAGAAAPFFSTTILLPKGCLPTAIMWAGKGAPSAGVSLATPQAWTDCLTCKQSRLIAS
jgi:hypothetical protein